MEYIINHTVTYEETISERKILGTRVLSQRGEVIGRITELRFNPKKKNFEGIVVRTSPRKLLYIDRNHFERLSNDAIILTIEPSVLLIGKKVLTYEGEFIGKVQKVIREGTKNDINHLIIKSLLRGTFTITPRDIHSLGTTVILKDTHETPQKSFTKIFRRNNNH